jgi:hypothetical protein
MSAKEAKRSAVRTRIEPPATLPQYLRAAATGLRGFAAILPRTLAAQGGGRASGSGAVAQRADMLCYRGRKERGRE